jgi:hypothetical protein
MLSKYENQDRKTIVTSRMSRLPITPRRHSFSAGSLANCTPYDGLKITGREEGEWRSGYKRGYGVCRRSTLRMYC